MPESTSVVNREAELLLIEVSGIVERHSRLSSEQGKYFNVFEILGLKTDEVYGHTPFIANLLDPKGTHGQSITFIDLFFKLLRNLDNPVFKALPSDISQGHWNVFREQRFTNPEVVQPDITIKGPNTIVMIENKIGADDQERQLDRCWLYGRYLEFNTYLVYLTPEGKDASDYSYGKMTEEDRTHVACIGYCDFIQQWLSDCIKASANLPYIRETLFQYQNLTRDMSTGIKNKEMIMEIAEQLNTPNRIHAAQEIGRALLLVKTKIFHEFWSALEIHLSRYLPENISIWKAEEDVYHYSHLKNRYYKNTKNITAYGLGFTLLEFDDNITVGIRIAVDQQPYYGFKAFKGNDLIKNPDNVSTFSNVLTAQKKAKISLIPGKESWLGGWQYPQESLRLNFRKFNLPCVELSSKLGLEEHTSEFSKEITEMAVSFLEAYKSLK